MITSGLIITAIIALLLLIFRPEVRKLVDWVVSFKRLAKTAEGYTIEATQPSVPAVVDEKREQTIVAAEPVAITAELVADETPAVTERWVDALFEKRYDDAIRILEGLHAAATDVDERLTYKSAQGHVIFEKNAIDGLVYFDQLINEHPTKFQPYQWLALSYYWRGLLDKALEVLERGVARVDRKARLLDTKSDALVAAGRDEEAIAVAVQGVEAEPTYAESYLNLARIYERRDDVATARAWYLRGLDATAGSDSVLRPYARFAADKGLVGEAVLRYNQLVNRHPDSAEYRTLLGNAYLAAGFHSLALQAYVRANELANGTEGWILANIGNVYKNQGLYTEAVKYLKLALERESDSDYAHERLAQAQKAEKEERDKLEELLKTARHEMGKQIAATDGTA